MDEPEVVPDAEPEIPLAALPRLHPIRTLVIARDLAFRRRAMTVLGELGWVGFAIAAPDREQDLVGMVSRMRADVVVLDATACAPAVTRIVTDLTERVPRVGVVVVSEEDLPAPFDRPAVRKWGWGADLFHAVEVAHRDAAALPHEAAHGR